MECQYCKSNFKTNSSLNNHQKTAKYCLSLQGAKSKKLLNVKIVMRFLH